MLFWISFGILRFSVGCFSAAAAGGSWFGGFVGERESKGRIRLCVLKKCQSEIRTDDGHPTAQKRYYRRPSRNRRLAAGRSDYRRHPSLTFSFAHRTKMESLGLLVVKAHSERRKILCWEVLTGREIRFHFNNVWRK